MNPPSPLQRAKSQSLDTLPVPREPETVVVRRYNTGSRRSFPKRPPMPKKSSFSYSMSTFSAYGQLASERWLSSSHHHHHHHHQHHHHHHAHASAKDGDNMAESHTEKSDVASQNDEESIVSDATPKASTRKTLFMFLKACVSSGVLFLPRGFYNGGLGLSMVLMVLVAGVCLFSFLRLVKAHQRIGGDYGDLGGELYGRSIKYAVYFFIVISQLGFVCSYFIFVAGNLVNVVQGLSQCRVQLPMSVWIWVPLAVLIPMVLVRHIAKLSLTAIVADVFILFGLISVLYFTGVQLKQAGAGPNIQAVNVDGFALMIGTAVFSFECVGLVIPLAESMAQPEKFPLVVWMGMIIVCVIYLVIGSISYLAYGDRIQAAVIYNFPPGNPLTMAVQLMYSIAVILSIPLMLFPAIKITESCLFYKCPSGTQSQAVKWGKNLFRCALTFLCAATAQFVGGDNLDKFVALVGSVACIPLCYVFPGMFHWKIAQKMSDKILDMALVVLGVGLMAYTFWVAVDSFLQPMQPITKAQELCDAHHAI